MGGQQSTKTISIILMNIL